jgi:hypothetical protein
MTTTRLTPWQSITLTDSTRDVPATSARGIIALDEYRRTGSMAGYWPCDTEELAALDEVAAADAGLSVEEIDWSAFPAVDDVQRLRRRLRHMADCLAPLSPAELADAVAD